MSDFPELIGDREAAAIFGYTSKDISAFLRKLRPDYVCPRGQVDPRRARPVIVGRKRRWLTEDILKIIRER